LADGSALQDFLAREALGSPIEAAELGRPVNGLDAGPDAYTGDLGQLHSKLVDWFEQAERATTGEREASEKCRDYYDNRQWTEAEVKKLEKRGQAPIVVNKISDKVALLCGLERKARTDPKAYPRTPTEEDRAEAATQALRFIADENNLPIVTSEVYEDMLVEGFGGAELGIEDDGQGGVNITVTRVPWDRLWRDPHARARDFGDARYLGVVLWMDRDQLEEMYPGAGDVLTDTFAPQSGTYDDRPGQIAWQDTKRQRCRIVQVYWLEAGTWWLATISRAGFLAEPQQSPFLDRKGRSACPLVLMSAYIDRENRRYGMVSGLLGLQDEINKRRSKALHLLSVNRTIAEQGAVDNAQKAREEVARPDGFIEVNHGFRFEILPGGDLAMGQMQMLEHATAEMQAKGPNAAMSGTDPRDQSGRAIIAQQAGGAAANEPLADALRQWKRRVCEMAWMAARQFWREEKFLRITDDEGTTKWLPLNRPITLVEDLMSKPEPERAAMMQQMQLVPGDPRLNQVVRVENEIHNLEVDIVIEEGADVPALQAEQFNALSQMVPALPPPLQMPAWKTLIKSSNLKDKADLLKVLNEAEKAAAQQAQQQAPIMQAQQQAEIRGANAKASADEALAAERMHGAVAKIAQVHKQAAESPVLPIDGPGIQPKQQDQGGL
jgi:protein tyrosine/serine phosphatase